MILGITSPSASLFWVSFWACVGGIIVFIGLAMEKIAEWKEKIYSPPFFKPWNWLDVWGWRLLMLGIAVEIFVSGNAAKHDWETRQIAINNDPQNETVNDVSCDLMLFVKPFDENKAPKISQTDANIGGLIFADLLECDNVCDNCDLLGYGSFLSASTYSKEWGGIHVVLHWNRGPFSTIDHSKYPFPETKVKDLMDLANVLVVRSAFLPTNAVITSCTATVTINSSFRKHFEFSNEPNSVQKSLANSFGWNQPDSHWTLNFELFDKEHPVSLVK
jgi:hypothetical protein